MVNNLEDLDFADDLALLPHRIKDMRDKTKKLYEKGIKIGLKFNIKKTKIMKVMTRKGVTISVEGEDIEEVDQFTYLVSIVSKTGGTEKDINSRISKGRQAFAMLKPVWKSNALDWNPQGCRRRGRPTHSWRRTRLKELDNIGTIWREAKQIAQNRVRWRMTVSALCSVRDEED
ncbi:uncharacterized protein LOC130055019 [Ostrea edulis]|uniref:uncharacterized protein LOC130055019 n=1 Tax=Ostrea edulis TaxID=37623 RepID=UPI0024AF2D79|nr:uncharacterized protein LOC130055019 [Ostrea edulis]